MTDVINPATGKVLQSVPSYGLTETDEAIARASVAFESWRDTTPATRQLALLRIADAIEERAEDLIAAEVRNTGKPVVRTAGGPRLSRPSPWSSATYRLVGVA